MKSAEKITEEIVILRYYNVIFYLFFKPEVDELKKQYLVKKIDTGESVNMKQIQKWCYYHQIFFKTKFVYRKDYSVMANLWNFYSSYRFIIEKRLRG